MDIAPAALVGPLLMLLSYVALGWLAAQRLKLDPRPIATLLVYLIAPFTIFRALMNGGPTPDYLLLTLALFILASLMARRCDEHCTSLSMPSVPPFPPLSL